MSLSVEPPQPAAVCASSTPLGAPALRKAQSVPANLDTYVRTPRWAPFATVLAAFSQVLTQAQRPLTPEDHERARKDPVCGNKAVEDLINCGYSAQSRRARRCHRQGQPGRERAHRAVAVVAGAPYIASGGIAGAVAMGARWAVQRATGATFWKARTEGGVREDVILEALHHWHTQLTGPLDWMFADRDPRGPLWPSDVCKVTGAAAQVDAALRQYVAQHPDPRVRYSEPLRVAFRLLRASLTEFYADLVNIAARTAPLPPSQPCSVAPPKPSIRAWQQAESGFLNQL